MKQVLQSLRDGSTEVADVPFPSVRRGHLLIRTTNTLISAGTERMLVDFGKGNWISKARQQPDKVRMVLDKVKTDGLIPTIETVFNKLNQPLPLGYCNVGVVLEVGNGVSNYKNGERVVSNGKHAEAVVVPNNLIARIPDAVSDEEAAFTVIGAIGLQGIRLANPTLGEVVVVTGLGLIGLVTVQLLRAHGCRVLGIDYDREKLDLARQFGADTVDLSAGEDPLAAAKQFSRGRGVDAVLITASTKSNEPVHQAAEMCRKRGRIVLVGVAGLELSRADFFEKELTFQVSCSYGPGRYDPSYEEKGNDYPVGYVRWTEQRNFEAVLDMMAEGRLNVKPLISHRYDIADAVKAYEVVGGAEKSLGIILQYSGINYSNALRTLSLIDESRLGEEKPERATNKPAVSFLGSGSYAISVLIPAFKNTGVRLRNVASSAGVSGVYSAKKFGFELATTDAESLFTDIETDAVVITTRHDSHAQFVQKALASGKHVFVEKPLCVTFSELEEIEASLLSMREGAKRKPIIMVGFNRRFSPQIQKVKSLISGLSSTKAFVMTVNAGAIPSEHWTQDKDIGGGRIIGEVCHFIDLLRFLAGSRIVSWQKSTLVNNTSDTLSIQLAFEDGSIGTIHYFANGNKSFPKERLEVFAQGRILQLDNFRKMRGYGWPGFRNLNLWRQDKGQRGCAMAFVDAVERGVPTPIPIEELLEVSRVTIEIAHYAYCPSK